MLLRSRGLLHCCTAGGCLQGRMCQHNLSLRFTVTNPHCAACPPAISRGLQVRVLRDYSDVVFSSGKVSLQRGKSHWLPGDEVHPLVMDGVLELVGGCGNS